MKYFGARCRVVAGRNIRKSSALLFVPCVFCLEFNFGYVPVYACVCEVDAGFVRYNYVYACACVLIRVCFSVYSWS